MDWIDILIKALPGFLGDSLHDWIDIVVKATPAFGAIGLSAIMIISGFFLIFMMAESDR